MIKRLCSGKLSFVWMAISSAIIIAGVVLFALFGFNMKADVPSGYSFEVKYDTVVTAEQMEDKLKGVCENAFAANGLSAESETVAEVEGFNRVVKYVFDHSANKDALLKAETAVEEALAKDGFENAMTYVSVNTVESESFTEAQWRGAVALAVGVIVALIYVLIRFGAASALGGLIAAIHDAFFTLAVLAVCRIPVFAFMPVTLAALAAFLSLLAWVLVGSKIRENGKAPEFAGDAQEIVFASVSTMAKAVLSVSIALVVFFVLLGTLATKSATVFFLPALIPVAVCTYSSLVFMPAITAKLKEKLDRASNKRKRYQKSKTSKSAEPSDSEEE